jgi:hypothetical protein
MSGQQTACRKYSIICDVTQVTVNNENCISNDYETITNIFYCSEWSHQLAQRSSVKSTINQWAASLIYITVQEMKTRD